MEKFSILILVAFFAINSLEKAESVKVKLEETPLKTFDEIFGEGWWDKGEAEDLKTPAPTNFGQIVPNSTDQNPPLTEVDHSGQIEPNSTDQNPPLTESDHFGQNQPNSTDQNPPLTESDHRKIVQKFLAIKDKFKQKGKCSVKERTKVENEIAKHLKVNRSKIYKWKKEFGLRQKKTKNERKNLVEKFDQMKAELKRDGFKNSYKQEIDENVAKELGLSVATIGNWKRQLGQIVTNYSDDEKLEIVKKLMQMESAHSGEDKKSCKEIAERFGVNVGTINKWKKEFGLSQKVINKKKEQKNLIEKFDQIKAELKRNGFKNSYKEINETVAKELGLSDTTIYKWKRKLGQTIPNYKYAHSEQKELMKRYYDIKDKNPKFRDEDIAKMFKIARDTLRRWKKQFKRQQIHPNSVDGHEHSVEENAAANVQEIESSNSWSI